jgi:carbon monoxide dehydrogenase subunit G
MPMNMKGEVRLPADRTTVWTRLNDPDTLKACIPGCQELVKESDTAFRATTKLAIGPVKATFKGKVTLSDIDPPNGYTITGEGEGGIAGFAKGGAKVHLGEAEGGGTTLSYDVQANVGGKIAQLGSRLIDGVAKKMSDAFFANFAKAVAGPAEGAS